MDCDLLRYFRVLRPEKACLEKVLENQKFGGNAFFLTMLFGSELVLKIGLLSDFESCTFDIY
jgi:hypothetical protein